ncbi:MAG TPA: Crp/Fnr family transcriptional regulator [Chloroflexota bacterium]|nr:Crp/Fnr family transcriptional regulator [Chloroflexota bacterium]
MTLTMRMIVERYSIDVPLLQRSQFFSALDEAAFGELVPLAHVHVFRPGMLISETAGFSDSVFIVARGRVHCYRLSSAGSPVTLCILHGGDLFTEPRVITPGIPAYTPGPRVQPALSAHFQTVTEVVVYCFPTHAVQVCVSADWRAAAAWTSLQNGWMSDLYSRLEELAIHDVPQRLAHTLARLSATSDDSMVLETHQELAWLVGASRETITKELNKLRRMKLIEYEQHHTGIRVADSERLRVL